MRRKFLYGSKRLGIDPCRWEDRHLVRRSAAEQFLEGIGEAAELHLAELAEGLLVDHRRPPWRRERGGGVKMTSTCVAPGTSCTVQAQPCGIRTRSVDGGRERLSKQLQCVGTSATMKSEGSIEERGRFVARARGVQALRHNDYGEQRHRGDARASDQPGAQAGDRALKAWACD